MDHKTSQQFKPTLDENHRRFHKPHAHLHSTFGNNWFSLKAEAFARFFGTPIFLISQTLVVLVWIMLNTIGVVKFDLYPFILLNLAFSLQAAYAAPLILLAQTRQSDRDKMHSEADSKHREAIAEASEFREQLALEQTSQIIELIKQNTKLTETTQQLSQRIETLTKEVHSKILKS